MRKVTLIAISVTVILGLCLAGVGCAAQEDDSSAPSDDTFEPMTLKMATFSKDGDIRQDYTYEWGDRITAATDGKILFDYYPAESLVTAKERSDALKAGIIDMTTWFSHGYTPEDYPFFSAVNLMPLAYESTYENFQAANWGAVEIAEDEAISGNQKNLWFMRGDYGQEWFMADPIDPDDLDATFIDKNIRAPGSLSATLFLSMFNAEVVSSSAPEIYELAEKGVVDGCTMGTSMYYNSKTYEVLPHNLWGETFFNVVATNGCIMRLDLWNTLPRDIQDAIWDVSQEIEEEFFYAYKDECDRIRDELKGAGLATYHLIPDEKKAEWKAGFWDDLDAEFTNRFPDKWPELDALLQELS